MKLLRMTASFGRLEKSTLPLTDGLNLLEQPNESGKSTWAAFLLAMLYGVDSGERASKGVLPAKTKFKPWSGAPMEGSLEVEWQGRRITIERSTRGRVPMGEFRAYDSDSGQPVDGLTAETCGQQLLGVERSVFERSAFFRQAGIAVTGDAALERRLAALVTTGDESVSYQESAVRLHDWKNRCRHNKTGLLPQAQTQLDAVMDALAQIREIHRSGMSLRARREELQAQKAELTRVLGGIAAQDAAKKLQQKLQAEQAVRQAEARRDAQAQTVHKLPSREVLDELNRQLDALQQAPPAQTSPLPQAPACPAVFAGLREDEILPKAQRDAAEYETLCAGKDAPTALFALLAALGTALALVGALAAHSVWLLGAGFALLVFGAVQVFLGRRRNRLRTQRLDRAGALIQSYGCQSKDEFVPLAADYHGKLLVYLQQKQQYDALLAEQAQAAAERTAIRARLLGQVSMFSLDAADEASAKQAVLAALAQYDALGEDTRQVKLAQARFEAVCAALGEVQQMPVTADFSGYDPARVQAALGQTNAELEQIRSRLDLNRGREAALGDSAALQAEAEQLQEQISALSVRLDALELAEQALGKASETLQSRFAPQLGALAGAYLARLTGDRYDRVLLDREMNVAAGERGEALTRQLLCLSRGAVDQVYLAVRLAICDLVLGPDAPLVLDDALVSFDDARLQNALTLLQEEAAHRQILLFTCQSRERLALGSMTKR